MEPVFFADPKDLRLRSEQQAFLLGDNVLVIPAFAENPVLPYGIWENMTLIDGEYSDKYQAKLKIKGGSIVPVGKVIQSTTENSFEPLTLLYASMRTEKLTVNSIGMPETAGISNAEIIA